MEREDNRTTAVRAAVLEAVKPVKGSLRVSWLPAGVMALEGSVASLADKQKADAIAHEAAGRAPVYNALDIAVVPDDELTGRARKALHEDAGFASLGVHVEGGIAILGGRAEGLAVVRGAREALARVPGVRGIRHDRVVLHLDREREEIEILAALDDWDILAGVRYRLAEELGRAKASRIVPICRNGTVTLTGVVDHRSTRRRAEDCARRTFGVETVRNLIMAQEEPPPRAKGLERRIRQAIGRRADAGRANVRVHRIEDLAYLLGEVGYQEEAWQAMALAREEPGVNQVFDCLIVAGQGDLDKGSLGQRQEQV